MPFADCTSPIRIRKNPDFQAHQAGNSIQPPNMNPQTRIKMTPGDKDIHGLCISFESSQLWAKPTIILQLGPQLHSDHLRQQSNLLG